MALPKPEAGLVVRYDFLWRSEAERGGADGHKIRPCSIILTLTHADGEQVVTVVPITHATPDQRMNPIEIPAVIKRRLGLDAQRSWIITHELNTFTWPGPDLRVVDPNADPRSFAYGHLPASLVTRVLAAVREHVKTGRARALRRSE